MLDSDWPQSIRMPTGSGKTSVIDIAAFHLALEAASPKRRAPLRIVFVVDRRLVVDDAFAHAQVLAERISGRAGPVTGMACDSLVRTFGIPLRAVRLRGGVPGDDAWARRPDVPLAIVSTVDQAGSRLLFRGYGVSDSMKPVHAGLLGTDVLYVLDEADTSRPFLDTLEQISSMRGEKTGKRPFAAVFMSATLRHSGDSTFPPEGGMDKALSADEGLAKRAGAHKYAKLVEARGRRKTVEKLAESAIELSILGSRNGGRGAAGAEHVGVVANTVSAARETFELLREMTKEAEGASVHLLTGRARPLDRDRFLGGVIGSIRPGRRSDKPSGASFLVSTQCIEVGVDVDFDAMVTQLAPLDSLRQRFGRLDRIGDRGNSEAVIVADKSSMKKDDPIYGDRLPATWDFLGSMAKEGKVDFGIRHLDVGNLTDGEMDCVTSPRPRRTTLMPSYVRALAQTRPHPYPDPDPSLFLHGHESGPADVRIIWRADITEHMLGKDCAVDSIHGVFVCPPSSLEAAAVPVWAARKWLAGSERSGDVADIEGTPGEEVSAEPEYRRVVIWRGARDKGTRTASGGEISPGDTIIVPTGYGGCDMYGWDGQSDEPVEDLGMAANLAHRRRLAMRLDRETVVAAGGAGAWSRVMEATTEHSDDDDIGGFLSSLAKIDGIPDAWKAILSSIDEGQNPTAVHAEDGGRRRIVGFRTGVLPDSQVKIMLGALGIEIATPGGDGHGEPDVEGGSHSYGREVGLDEHCRGVRDFAGEFCGHIGMDPATAGDVSLAALLHDAGKAEPRFQAYLRGKDPDGVSGERLIAKSGRPALRYSELEAYRKKSRLPEGQRHECWSVQLAERHPGLGNARDPDLVRYLIGTHHGHGRPMFPPVDDGQPPTTVELEIDGRRIRCAVDGGMARLGSGWADTYRRAYDKYGPWELAHMEAIVRLADHCQSRKEAGDG